MKVKTCFVVKGGRSEPTSVRIQELQTAVVSCISLILCVGDF